MKNFFVAVFAFSITSTVVEGAPTSPLNTHDTAMLLPARSPSEVEKLLPLSATPKSIGLEESIVPLDRGYESPVLSEETFLALVENEEVKTLYREFELAEVPAYENWKIVAARFIPCARPTENIDGQRQNVDMLTSDFVAPKISQTCQLEHRLSAQPFDDEGQVLPFAIHVISRPYRSGDPRSHALSREMLAGIRAIKAASTGTNPVSFDIYPDSTSDHILEMINDHIVQFHGGGLLRTLAVMASSPDGSKIAFWSGSGRNPDGAQAGDFRFSTLIRPRQPGLPDEQDIFQYLDTFGDRVTSVTLDASATELPPTPGSHIPSMFAFLENPDQPQAQQQVLDVNNTRKFFLPNLDCGSCHGVTSHVTSFGADLQGTKFSAEDAAIITTAHPQNVLQNSASDFVALGYRRGNGGNQPSVAQVLINDAAMTSSFINRTSDFWKLDQTAEAFADASKLDSNPLNIQDFTLMRNTRIVARQFALTSRGSFSLASGMRVSLGENPTFSTDWEIDSASLPLQLSDSDAQLVADLLQTTGFQEVPHSEIPNLKMIVLANQKDEVFITSSLN